jgi:hypothetical protein
MNKYVGICRGGPYDGRSVASSVPLYRAAIRTALPLRQPDTEASVPQINYSEYRYVLGQWVWRGPSVPRRS